MMPKTPRWEFRDKTASESLPYEVLSNLLPVKSPKIRKACKWDCRKKDVAGEAGKCPETVAVQRTIRVFCQKPPNKPLT